MSIFRARGDSLFNAIDPITKLSLGFKKLDGTTKLEVKINSSMKTELSKGRYTAGMIIGAVPDVKPTGISLEFNDFTKEAMTLAFMGSNVAISAGGGTVTDEVAVAKKGIWLPLLNKNFTALSVEVTNSAGLVTYTEGVDYEIDYVLGFFFTTDAGAITDAQSIKVSYAHGAYAGYRVKAEKVRQVRGAYIFNGINEADDSIFILEVPLMMLTSNTALDVLGDNVGTLKMEATPILKAGEESPYYIEVR